jgi:hypothetical protein
MWVPGTDVCAKMFEFFWIFLGLLPRELLVCLTISSLSKGWPSKIGFGPPVDSPNIGYFIIAEN